jgi:hypothetical protein
MVSTEDEKVIKFPFLQTSEIILTPSILLSRKLKVRNKQPILSINMFF